MRRTALLWCGGIAPALLVPATAAAQSSSLFRGHTARLPAEASPFQSRAATPDDGVWAAGRKVDTVAGSTRVIERSSLMAVAVERPRPIQPNDLITIIVREQKKYESNARADNQKKWNVNSELSDWFHLYDHYKLGADRFPYGKPGVQFQWDNKTQNKAQDDREDKFVTRITGRVVDVKPNGTVVIEAKKYEKHDEEESVLTLTGTCRAADITPDNTILSTQVHDLKIVETNTGAVRDTTRRGWIPRMIDFLRPF